MRGLALLSLLALTGCVAFDQGPKALAGSFGGPHIGVDLAGGLGTVQFDCAAGTIDQAINSDGPFSAPGTYLPGQAGPVRVGQVFTVKRATYAGIATKTDLTMTVTLEDGEVLGPYSLTFGAPAQVTRCPLG
jgi:hypothetical protein